MLTISASKLMSSQQLSDVDAAPMKLPPALIYPAWIECDTLHHQQSRREIYGEMKRARDKGRPIEMRSSVVHENKSGGDRPAGPVLRGHHIAGARALRECQEHWIGIEGKLAHHTTHDSFGGNCLCRDWQRHPGRVKALRKLKPGYGTPLRPRHPVPSP